MTDMRCRHIIVEDGVMNFILQKTGFSLVKSRLAQGSPGHPAKIAQGSPGCPLIVTMPKLPHPQENGC